ncbi:MAG: ATP-binding cassette domain-containing protein [Gemmatimonadetes bacterium]|nr:ATP-binding cassette domain-containing protein [Gemmatimonadota bacterium]
MTPLLQLTGIHKRFGQVEALRDVSFRLEPGEIHALLGENGAGKSTLMKVAYGLVAPDAGTIRVRGSEVHLADAVAARRHGIGMVHQHFTSIPALTVAENVALAAGWRPVPREIRARVSRLAEEFGLPLDPSARVEDLSAGLKQRLEVVKALASEAALLLLDEPSSVLPPDEAAALLETIRRFRTRGIPSVLITHKLHEALAVADRVTVLRRGAVVHEGPIAGETPASLATHMLGTAPPAEEPPAPAGGGEVRVRLTDVRAARLGASGSALHAATLEVRAGEIVGVAAVEGNGQRELLRVMAGTARPTGGQVTLAHPVSFIPEDRTAEALVGEFSLAENLVLARGEGAPWVRGPWLDWAQARARTRELMTAFGVQAPGPGARAASLSGGNQQRMVIAAALERGPRVLVAENPTRGLDLRATAEVHARLRAAAAAGVAVVVHMGDLDELLALATRVVVVAGGRATSLPPGAPREVIGRQMLGGPA